MSYATFHGKKQKQQDFYINKMARPLGFHGCRFFRHFFGGCRFFPQGQWNPLGFSVLLMVQKSQGQPPKIYETWYIMGINCQPTSTGEWVKLPDFWLPSNSIKSEIRHLSLPDPTWISCWGVPAVGCIRKKWPPSFQPQNGWPLNGEITGDTPNFG